MKKQVIFVLCGGLFSGPVLAAAPAEAQSGEALHQTHCVSCHATITGGDGNSLYTRATRQVTNYSQLQNQVERCNQNLGLKWFDTEINEVAAYLNRDYYKFALPDAKK